MAKKRVLLAMPSVYSLENLIENELKRMGYDVVVLNEKEPFTFIDRIECKVREIIFGDKKIRRTRYLERIRKIPQSKQSLFDKFDICLVIRADVFSKRILKKVRKISKKMISYHFDGVNKFGFIFDKVKYFDDFYVFDKHDVLKYPEFNLKLATNFYFKKPQEQKSEIDFYFLGYYNDKRVKPLNELSDYFNENSISFQFDIVFIEYIRDKVKEHCNIQAIFKGVEYEEYLMRMEKSKYILDILVGGHSGLSFRIIESLWYKKKVVTNNVTVKDYDFYTPENIFILEERPLSELKDFLQSDYKEVDPDIVEKYSFEYWFNEKVK